MTAIRRCPAARGRFEKRQERRVAHAHAPGARHLSGLGDDDGNGFPAVLRVGRHRQDGVHGAGFKEPLGEAGGDPGPLRAFAWRLQRGAVHRAIGAEEALLGAVRIAGAAVDA